MFLRSDDDHNSVRNAKKYFNSAMKLAESLKENPQTNKSTFLKEYIDAHNNIGMLQKDLDNLEEAENILIRGLKICDEEEVAEQDDGRTRLHHNLGNVYVELRKWAKACEHIEKDIVICKQIRHCQGEAKGYINLGELYYRVQKYEETICCYKKALDLARSMEDEDALAGQIEENIKTVKQAIKVIDELNIEEKNLSKLERTTGTAKGTSGERKCLRQQNASLDCLIEKSSMISAWMKHRDFAKKKKKIASKLCDKEKLSDSFLVVGESYQKLRDFNKAIKWYTKSWELYNTIGNLEGKALAKINIGGVLDSSDNWAGALDAFEEGYRIAFDAEVPSVQLSALENMHYSHMIRFDNVEEARRLQAVIDKLKQSKTAELEPQIIAEDCCSETETQGDDQMSNSRSDVNRSPEISKSSFVKLKSYSSSEDLIDDVPSNSHLLPNENLSKLKTTRLRKPITTREPTEALCRSISRSTDSQAVSRKRVRVILSDDEGQNDELQCSRGRFHNDPAEDVPTSDEFKRRYDLSSTTHGFQDVSPVASKCVISANTPVNLEENTCSYKSRISKLAAQDTNEFRSSSMNEVVNASNTHINATRCDADVSGNLSHKQKTYLHDCDEEHCQHITFKIEDDFVSVELSSFTIGDKLSTARMKVEVACLYYLQLTNEKRSKGLLPIIQHMKCNGRVLESLESIDMFTDYLRGKGWIDVYFDVWLLKRLMQLYIDCCKELLEPPYLNLLKKLYNVEVSEDEVIVSDCELQDMSVAPLLKALHLHKAVAVLDLSHNLLGNETMEKLKQLFTSSSQEYGGLILDLHHNRFGPTALFQICECPVLFARLEVLNISGNRLTDSCASYLAKILKNCKALCSLNIESCSITSRTIQQVADSLDSGSVLAQLCLGYNYPISRIAMVNLLAKLGTLERFSELNLNGLKLSTAVVDGLCQLAKTSCLSELMLGHTSIGTDGALKLMEALSSETQELVKLDLSFCGLTSHFFVRLDAKVALISDIIELNLGGNSITQEGVNALVSLLKDTHCCLQVLELYKCQFGLAGVIRILEALAENCVLVELNLAANLCLDESHNLPNNFLTVKESSNSYQTDPNFSSPSVKASEYEAEAASRELCAVNTECNQLEVADSEDDQVGVKRSVSGMDDSCTSSSKRDLSNVGCQFIQELSDTIRNVKQLQILDLSDNGFSEQVAETLYSAWSSSSRASLAENHIQGTTIHFKVQGTSCCSLKPCCRRI